MMGGYAWRHDGGMPGDMMGMPGWHDGGMDP